MLVWQLDGIYRTPQDSGLASSADALFSSQSFTQILKAALYNLDLLGGGQVRLTPLLPTLEADAQLQALRRRLNEMGRADVEATLREGGLYLKRLAPEQNGQVVHTRVPAGLRLEFIFPPPEPDQSPAEVVQKVMLEQLTTRLGSDIDTRQMDELVRVYDQLASQYLDEPGHERRVQVEMGEDSHWRIRPAGEAHQAVARRVQTLYAHTQEETGMGEKDAGFRRVFAAGLNEILEGIGTQAELTQLRGDLADAGYGTAITRQLEKSIRSRAEGIEREGGKRAASAFAIFSEEPGVSSALDALRGIKTAMDETVRVGTRRDSRRKQYDEPLRNRYLLGILRGLDGADRAALREGLERDTRFSPSERAYLDGQIDKCLNYMNARPRIVEQAHHLDNLPIGELQERMRLTVGDYLRNPGVGLASASARTFNALLGAAMDRCQDPQQLEAVARQAHALIGGTYLQKVSGADGKPMIDIDGMAQAYNGQVQERQGRTLKRQADGMLGTALSLSFAHQELLEITRRSATDYKNIFLNESTFEQLEMPIRWVLGEKEAKPSGMKALLGAADKCHASYLRFMETTNTLVAELREGGRDRRRQAEDLSRYAEAYGDYLQSAYTLDLIAQRYEVRGWSVAFKSMEKALGYAMIAAVGEAAEALPLLGVRAGQAGWWPAVQELFGMSYSQAGGLIGFSMAFSAAGVGNQAIEGIYLNQAVADFAHGRQGQALDQVLRMLGETRASPAGSEAESAKLLDGAIESLQQLKTQIAQTPQTIDWDAALRSFLYATAVGAVFHIGTNLKGFGEMRPLDAAEMGRWKTRLMREGRERAREASEETTRQTERLQAREPEPSVERRPAQETGAAKQTTRGRTRIEDRAIAGEKAAAAEPMDAGIGNPAPVSPERIQTPLMKAIGEIKVDGEGKSFHEMSTEAYFEAGSRAAQLGDPYVASQCYGEAVSTIRESISEIDASIARQHEKTTGRSDFEKQVDAAADQMFGKVETLASILDKGGMSQAYYDRMMAQREEFRQQKLSKFDRADAEIGVLESKKAALENRLADAEAGRDQALAAIIESGRYMLDPTELGSKNPRSLTFGEIVPGSQAQIEGRRTWKIAQSTFDADYFGAGMEDIYVRSKTVDPTPLQTRPRYHARVDYDETTKTMTLKMEVANQLEGVYVPETSQIGLRDQPSAFGNLETGIHELNHRVAFLAGKPTYPHWLHEGFTEMLAWDRTVEMSAKLEKGGDARFKPKTGGLRAYEEEVAVARAVETRLAGALLEQAGSPEAAQKMARGLIKEAYYRNDFGQVWKTVDSKYPSTSAMLKMEDAKSAQDFLNGTPNNPQIVERVPTPIEYRSEATAAGTSGSGTGRSRTPSETREPTAGTEPTAKGPEPTAAQKGPAMDERMIEEQEILHDAKNCIINCDSPIQGLQAYLSEFGEGHQVDAARAKLGIGLDIVRRVEEGFDALTKEVDPAGREEISKQVKAEITQAQEQIRQISADVSSLLRERPPKDAEAAADIEMFNTALLNYGYDIQSGMVELQALAEQGAHRLKMDRYNILPAIKNYCNNATKQYEKYREGPQLQAYELDPISGQRTPIDLLDPEKYIGVEYDPALLRRALRNIFSNGQRYGGQKAWVELEVRPDEVRIRFQDDGTGFKPQDAGRAFDYKSGLEQQVEGSTQVGLYHTRRSIEEMGGTIEVVSGPLIDGNPTAIEVRLPRKNAGEPLGSTPSPTETGGLKTEAERTAAPGPVERAERERAQETVGTGLSRQAPKTESASPMSASAAPWELRWDTELRGQKVGVRFERTDGGVLVLERYRSVPIATLSGERVARFLEEMQVYREYWGDLKGASDVVILPTLSGMGVTFKEWEARHPQMDLLDFVQDLNRQRIPHEMSPYFERIRSAMREEFGVEYDAGFYPKRYLGTNPVFEIRAGGQAYLLKICDMHREEVARQVLSLLGMELKYQIHPQEGFGVMTESPGMSMYAFIENQGMLGGPRYEELTQVGSPARMEFLKNFTRQMAYHWGANLGDSHTGNFMIEGDLSFTRIDPRGQAADVGMDVPLTLREMNRKFTPPEGQAKLFNDIADQVQREDLLLFREEGWTEFDPMEYKLMHDEFITTLTEMKSRFNQNKEQIRQIYKQAIADGRMDGSRIQNADQVISKLEANLNARNPEQLWDQYAFRDKKPTKKKK